MAALTYRRATPDDAAALAALTCACFAGYTAFAPPGWAPPGDDDERELAAEFARRLGDGSGWALIAEDGGRHAGQAAILPAAQSGRPEPDPALAHLWQLFVAEPWWGSGVALALHAAALAEAAARGFTAMRLFTPADHGRARRFYEREGWALSGPREYDERIGFDIVEYRRPLVTGS